MRHGVLVFGLGIAVALGGAFYGCGGDSGSSNPDAASSSGGSGAVTGGRGGTGLPGTGGSGLPGTGGSGQPGTGGSGQPGTGGSPAAGGSPGTAGAGGGTARNDAGADGPGNPNACPANPMGKACMMNQFCTSACTNGMREQCTCMNGMFACTMRTCMGQRDGGARDAQVPMLTTCPAGAATNGDCTRSQNQGGNVCEVAACANGRHTVCFCGSNSKYNCQETNLGCQ